MKKWIWILITGCIGVSGMAQHSFQFGILPAVNLNKKLTKGWKLNFKIESRQTFKEGFFREENNFNYQYIQTDFALVGAKSVGFGNSLAGGYLMRIKDGQRIDRLIQQFVLKRSYASFKLAHRFSSDQTFEKDKEMKFRLRYRLSSAFPLNGQSIDPKEFYFKINNEYLNIFQNNDYNLEIRVVPFIGYVITDSNKLEIGLDYRLDSFIDKDSQSKFWIGINWYLAI